MDTISFTETPIDQGNAMPQNCDDHATVIMKR